MEKGNGSWDRPAIPLHLVPQLSLGLSPVPSPLFLVRIRVKKEMENQRRRVQRFGRHRLKEPLSFPARPRVRVSGDGIEPDVERRGTGRGALQLIGGRGVVGREA